MADPILLPIGETFEIEFRATRKDATTGASEAATGLTAVVGRLSLTRTGAVIGSCSVTLSERGSTGVYYGSISSATLTADLATYVNRTLYLIVGRSGTDYRWWAYTPVTSIEGA